MHPSAAVFLVFASVSLQWLDLQPTTVTARVVDGSGTAVAFADVGQVHEGRVVVATQTDPEGRFELEPVGSPPYLLRFLAIGYGKREVTFGKDARSWPHEVVLPEAPVELDPVGVDAEREAFRFEFTPGKIVTEKGIRSPFGGCGYLVWDSVVVRTPELYGPRAENYHPAEILKQGYGVWLWTSGDRLEDPRLRERTYPCLGVLSLLRHRRIRAIDRTAEAERITPEFRTRTASVVELERDPRSAGKPDLTAAMTTRHDQKPLSRPTGQDFPVPMPLGPNHHIWTAAADPRPFDPGRPEDPEGRTLWSILPDGRPAAVLDRLHPGPGVIDVALAGEPIVAGNQPFSEHPLYRVDPAAGHVTIVHRRLELAVWWSIYAVTRISATGDTLFHAERTAPRVELTDSIFDAAVAEIAALPVVRETHPEPTVREFVVAGVLDRPPFVPPVTDLVVGRDGTTWLELPITEGGRTRWDVLDPAGEPLRTVWVESSLRVLDADGDRVWGVGAGIEAGTASLLRLQPVR